MGANRFSTHAEHFPLPVFSTLRRETACGVFGRDWMSVGFTDASRSEYSVDMSRSFVGYLGGR